MTGLDCLKEEMAKRGCTKAQTESKTAAIVMDILAAEGTTKFTDFYEIEKELGDKARELNAREEYLSMREQHVSEAEEALKARERDIEKMISTKFKAIELYVNSFQTGLERCETAEGRDMMRRAQVFKNSVSINTPQNNTAYIEGLANILAGGKGDFGGLRKLMKTEGYPEYTKKQMEEI